MRFFYKIYVVTIVNTTTKTTIEVYVSKHMFLIKQVFCERLKQMFRINIRLTIMN